MKKNLNGLLWALGLSALGALSACSSLPPPTLLSLPLPSEPAPAATTSVLAKAVPPASSASSAAAAKFLIVRRVNVPEYLQTDAVRYRAADNTLAEWPGTAWAERLEVGLTGHLVLQLRQALPPGWSVCDAHCPAWPNGLVLVVDISPLDYVRPAGQLRADVHWRVMDASGAPKLVSSGGSALTEAVTPDSPVGQATAMSKVLGNIALEVAQALR
jgi:uncharacterized lipoprotein YmbA